MYEFQIIRHDGALSVRCGPQNHSRRTMTKR